MTVRKRGHQWVVDFWFKRPDGRKERIRRASPVNTRRGAEDYERQLRNELLFPTRPEKEVKFDDFAEEFQEVYVQANVKFATQVSYESTIRTHLEPEFGKFFLEQITSQQIERFKARLVAKGRAPATVRNVLGVLSKMLHVARDWGYLNDVPRIKLPKVPKPRFRLLAPEEIEALLEAAGPYWYAPIYFALMTGCRQGELWPMERQQLDLDSCVVHIDKAVWRGHVGLPKHDKIRTVDLSPRLVGFLRNHFKVIPMKSRLVFPARGGGMRHERRALKGLRRAAKRAKLVPFGWHVLRHAFASNLVMQGVPLQAVQELLGHSRIDETMRYSHLSPHVKREAVATLDHIGKHEVDERSEQGAGRTKEEKVGHYLGTSSVVPIQRLGIKK